MFYGFIFILKRCFLHIMICVHRVCCIFVRATASNVPMICIIWITGPIFETCKGRKLADSRLCLCYLFWIIVHDWPIIRKLLHDVTWLQAILHFCLRFGFAIATCLSSMSMQQISCYWIGLMWECEVASIIMCEIWGKDERMGDFFHKDKRNCPLMGDESFTQNINRYKM